MFLERRCIVKTDFALLLHKYFHDYLVNDLGASGCTISSYRTAFVQFIDYMESVSHVAAGQIDLHHVTRQNILSFLDWLEENRSVSVATRNQRLAAIKSFAIYIRYERPEYNTPYYPQPYYRKDKKKGSSQYLSDTERYIPSKCSGYRDNVKVRDLIPVVQKKRAEIIPAVGFYRLHVSCKCGFLTKT